MRGRFLKPFLFLIVLLVVWKGIALAGIVKPQLLPSPDDLVRRLASEFETGALVVDIKLSVARHLTGLTIGAASGVALGLLLGLSTVAERLLGPLFLGYRQIALFAWIPLLSLWFGGNEVGKISFITLAAFSPAALNTWRGTRTISKAHSELAAVLTLGRIDYIRMIALPSALPQMLTGLRLAIITSWMATIGAELFLNVAPGLGARLSEGRDTFQMDLLGACVLVLAAIGMLYQGFFTATESWLLRRRTA